MLTTSTLSMFIRVVPSQENHPVYAPPHSEILWFTIVDVGIKFFPRLIIVVMVQLLIVQTQSLTATPEAVRK
jgi:hypothetical protein